MNSVRLWALTVLTTVVLTACSTAPAGFRDPAAPIASITRFSLSGFAGTWHVVARMAQPGDAAATIPETYRIDPDGAVALKTGQCNDWECTFWTEDHRLSVTGPGRYDLDGKEHWVLWVDADFRTAVIGTPSGAFGWIMENGRKTTPPDRLKAARDILDWAGYDLTRLVEVRP